MVLDLYRKYLVKMTDLVLGTENLYGTFGEEQLRMKNPFPKCPKSPNCLRLSVQSDKSINDLKKSFEEFIQSKKATLVHFDTESNTYHTEWTAGVFKDDLWLNLSDSSNGTLIHIKSASRVGFSDLAVNPNRVKSVLQHLNLESDLTKYMAEYTSF